MPEPKHLTIPVNFKMVDDDGTDKIRACASHAVEVGKAWMHLGLQMSLLADKFDELVTDPIAAATDARHPAECSTCAERYGRPPAPRPPEDT